MNSAGLHQVALIVALYAGEGDVSKTPVKSENYGSSKKIEFVPQNIGSIGMSAQFFQGRSHNQKK